MTGMEKEKVVMMTRALLFRRRRRATPQFFLLRHTHPGYPAVGAAHTPYRIRELQHADDLVGFRTTMAARSIGQ
jgi:hypothetical protein